MTSKEELVKCVELPGRGRGLVTTKAVHGGQIILRESPSLLHVSAPVALGYCSTCLCTCPPHTTPCSGCRAVTFCSSACSVLHSPQLCSALACLEKTGFEGDLADQARFLLAAYHLAFTSRPEFERLMLLEGDGIVDSPVRQLHAFLDDALRGWPWSSSGGQESVLTVEVTAGLLAKDARNTFGFMAPFKPDEERSVRGFGVYQTASFINHDCLPNSCRFDYLDVPGESNTDIYIRALHSIPKDTEVTISYFPINWSLKDRADRLLEEYGFKCVCERCQVEEDWSESDSECEDEDADEEHLEGLDGNHGNGNSTSGNEEVEGEGNGEVGEGGDIVDGGFEHAIFFVKFLCPIEFCGGTMAPLASTTAAAETFHYTMECNMCGGLRTGDEVLREADELQSEAADAWERKNMRTSDEFHKDVTRV